jgi:hypothetical protein
MNKEESFQNQLDILNDKLSNSRSKISVLKRKLTDEESRAIELQLVKASLLEAWRKHKASLPSCSEKEQKEKEIDEEFLRKLPFLLEKV